MNQTALVEQLKALGEVNRLALAVLVADRERGAGELLERLDLSQPSLSRHLKVLREAGVVRERRVGRNAYYRLGDGQLLHLVTLLAADVVSAEEPVAPRTHEQTGRNITKGTSVDPRPGSRTAEDVPARSSDFEEWLL